MYRKIETCNKNYASIDSEAEKLFNKYRLKISDDITSVIQDLGGNIKYVGIEEWQASRDHSITVNGKKDFEIIVSNFTGPLRDRFTLAHELGHYILHSNYGEKRIKAPRFETTKENYEADLFALGFLMPKTLFLEEYTKNKDTMYLASKFLVSLKTVEYRKKVLKLNCI